MIANYLLLGVGVYLGLTSTKFEQTVAGSPIAALQTAVATILFWPMYLYNNARNS